MRMQWNLLEKTGDGHAERISRLKIPKGVYFRRCAVRPKCPNPSHINSLTAHCITTLRNEDISMSICWRA